MTEIKSPQPQVFKDKISPTEAPAALGSATAETAKQKQDAVIKKLHERAIELAPQITAQPTPEEVGPRVESGQQTIAVASQKLEEVSRTEDVVPESGLNQFGFVRKLTGKRSEAEQAAQVSETQAALKEAEDTKNQAESDLKAAQMYGHEYLTKQTGQRAEELIQANQKGGPMAVSAEMVQALSRQDQLQAQMRFYKEKGYDAPPDKLLPFDVYLNTKSALEQRDPRSGMQASKEEIERRIIAMTAVGEVALEYTDQNHIPLDEKKYVNAVSLGQRITDGVHDGSGWEFVRSKRGERTSFNDVTYYAIGSAKLEEFFRRNNIPEGEARVPYILAYAAGTIANGVPSYLGNITRDWLADTLPCERTERVRKDGQWVDEPQPPKPRGLGSFVTRNDPWYSFAVQRLGTTDQGLVNVMKKAGDIARSIDNKFVQRNVDYNTRNNFNIAAVQDPPLKKI